MLANKVNFGISIKQYVKIKALKIQDGQAQKKFASQIPGLDKQKFDSCIDSQKYKSFVDSDITLGVSLGIQGTPSFIIVKSDGSKPETLLGAQPFPSFQSILTKKSKE